MEQENNNTDLYQVHITDENPICMLYDDEREVSMDEIAEECELNELDVPSEDSHRYWDMITDIRMRDWYDFKGNWNCEAHTNRTDKHLPDYLVVAGSAGLWYGRRDIIPTVLPTEDFDKFWSKFSINGDFRLSVGYDKDGLFVNVVHHDGTNCYRLLEMTKKGIDYWKECEDSGEDPILLTRPEYAVPVKHFIF